MTVLDDRGATWTSGLSPSDRGTGAEAVVPLGGAVRRHGHGAGRLDVNGLQVLRDRGGRGIGNRGLRPYERRVRPVGRRPVAARPVQDPEEERREGGTVVVERAMRHGVAAALRGRP
jgi:hypothetical protein